MKKRILSTLLAAAMLLTTLAGCGSTYTETPAPEQEPSQEQTQPTERPKTKEGYGSVSFLSQEPNTLNMLTSVSNLDSDVFYLTSAMLYRYTEDGVVAELAEGYTVSEDGLTYTYTIKDAKYTDGTPVTAADFAYYLINSANSQNSLLAYVANGSAFMAGECDASAVGISAPDEKTLVVTLAAATAAFDPEMQILPVNQAFAESKGDALGGTPADMMYSGPYVLTDWTYGSSMTFAKNPDYINAEDSFQIAELKMVNTVDENTKYNMLVSGDVDIILSCSNDLVSRLSGSETTFHYNTGALQGLEFNTTGFYFDGTTFGQRDPEVTALLANKNFRMALAYALDREVIVSTIAPDYTATNRYMGTVYGIENGKSFADENPIDVAPVSGDAELAKEYLAKALEELGYASAADLPTVTYLTFESETFRITAETLQSEWKRVLGLENIEIVLKPIQDAIMSMVFMNYDIYYQCPGIATASALENMTYWQTGGGITDAMGAGAPFSSIYSDAEFDALVEQAKFELDDAKRNELLAQAEELLVGSYIFIPICDQGSNCVVSDRVSGFAYNSVESALMFNNATVND